MEVFHEHVWFIAFKVNCSPAEFNCASTLLQLRTYVSQQKLLFSLNVYKKKYLKKMFMLKKNKQKQNLPTNQPTKLFFSICHLRSKRSRITTSTECGFKCSCLQLFSHNSYSMFGHFFGNKIWNSHRETYFKNKSHLSILEFLTLDSPGCSSKQSKLNHHIQLWSLKLTLRSQQAFNFAILLSYSQKKMIHSYTKYKWSNLKLGLAQHRERTKEKLIDNVKEVEKC